MDPSEKITYFAETDARNQRVPFGIKAKDRTRHMYVIGKTGMGKSTALENMAVQDIRNGNGFAFLDPHGQSADLLLEYVPEERIDDVLYFAPFDMEHPIAFNIMEDVGYDKRHLVVSGLMAAFKKIWLDAWSARMEYILSNTLLALLEYPDSTLLSVNRMYSDKPFRKKVVDHITDTSVKAFWVDEFAKYNDKFAVEATAAIQNKIGQFTSNPLVRNIVGQPKSSFDVREVMDGKKIMLVNLSKGRIGESNANLLGSLLITKIYLAAMSRADAGSKDNIEELPNFYLFVDEFQSFANDTFADILSEARKYKLNLTIAHQYIEQMSDEVRAAVFGNVGTMASFRVGATDAEVLEKEFAPVFVGEDIVNLGFAQIYLRLMIDGIGSQPFSARTLPPLEKPPSSNLDAIVARSREQFTHPRAEVEKVVQELVEMGRTESGGGNGNGNNGGQQKTKPQQKKNEAKPINKETKDDLKAILAQVQGTEEKQEKKPVETKKKEEPKPELSRKEIEDQKRKLIDSEKEEWDGNAAAEIQKAKVKKDNEGKKKQDPKKVSPENKNELQAMLAGVMGDSTNKKPEPRKKQEKKKEVAKKVEEKVEQKPQTKESKKGPREIPEEELKDMLEVKE